MESARDRMFVIFKQMTGQTEINDELRRGAEQHLQNLADEGENDEQRLTVSGLTYLKQNYKIDA